MLARCGAGVCQTLTEGEVLGTVTAQGCLRTGDGSLDALSFAAPAVAVASLPPSEAYTRTPCRANSSDAATPLRPSPTTAASPAFHSAGIIAASAC